MGDEQVMENKKTKNKIIENEDKNHAGFFASSSSFFEKRTTRQ